jgi:3'-phosphoadenosine 5'-phosphosulfate sulfotransferase (PAPS reductase)/FAD synthetase
VEGPNGTNKIADWQLRQRQVMPLDLKVELSLRRIRDWCDHWDDMVYVAFSGGLDSTVLLHLARQVLPDCPAVFHDTGLEFPEIRDFVKTVDNVTWTKPRMTFKQVLEKHGYPVVSKRVAQYVGEVQRAKGDTATKRLRTTGIKSNGEYSPLGKVPDKWQYLFDAPFKISDHCCKIFKKYPARDYEEKTGRYGMIGTRTEEGAQRELAYLEHGCNGYDLTVPRSTPLAFWLHADIKQYIKENSLPYSGIYDMGYDRTGCAFCMLGCHMEKGKNRFQIMEESHPKLHDYCLNKLGLKDILQYIGVNPYNTQLELFNDDDDDKNKLTDN